MIWNFCRFGMMIGFLFGANCSRLNRADASPLPLGFHSPDPAAGVSGVGASDEDRLLVVSIGPLSVCPDVSTRSVPAGLSELAFCASIWRCDSRYRSIKEGCGFSGLSCCGEASAGSSLVSAWFAAGLPVLGFRREKDWRVESIGGSSEHLILRSGCFSTFPPDIATRDAGNISK